MSIVDCPAQIADGGVMVTTGSGLTVTVVWTLDVQPLVVPVTVYVVVLAGVAVTLEPVDELSVEEGLHE